MAYVVHAGEPKGKRTFANSILSGPTYQEFHTGIQSPSHDKPRPAAALDSSGTRRSVASSNCHAPDLQVVPLHQVPRSTCLHHSA